MHSSPDIENMEESLKKGLFALKEKQQKLGARLSSSEVFSQQKLYRDLSKEYAQLERIATAFDACLQCEEEYQSIQQLTLDEDEDLREMAISELAEQEEKRAELEIRLHRMLLPADLHDQRNVYLEIRAGTGGEEAAIFAKDLFRMYSKYCEAKRWTVEMVQCRASEKDGLKEVVAKISGKNVYAKMKFESGAHRVQRIPATESQGRIHTSAATVAILPEAEQTEEIDIDPADLRIDTYKSSGAGGQHVNKTDSAVRITYLPDNIVVECQDDRSQHKNKARAMAILHAKLLDTKRKEKIAKESALRKDLVGSGDRSDRIRTYNFPQRRVTDHRINLTLYSLPQFLDGDMDDVVDALAKEHIAEQMRTFQMREA